MSAREWMTFGGMGLAHLPKNEPPSHRSYLTLCGAEMWQTVREEIGDRPKCGLCKEVQDGVQGEN